MFCSFYCYDTLVVELQLPQPQVAAVVGAAFTVAAVAAGAAAVVAAVAVAAAMTPLNDPQCSVGDLILNDP